MEKEILLTKKQIKEKYKISGITLWIWELIGKLKPVDIPANKKYAPKGRPLLLFFKESDILKILK